MIDTYSLWEDVKVLSWGRWYTGQVTGIGRKRLKIEYTTGTGAVHESWFERARVRRG